MLEFKRLSRQQLVVGYDGRNGAEIADYFDCLVVVGEADGVLRYTTTELAEVDPEHFYLVEAGGYIPVFGTLADNLTPDVPISAGSELAELWLEPATRDDVAALSASVAEVAARPVARHVQAVTDVDGVAVVVWPEPFSAPPTVTVGLETSDTAVYSTRISLNMVGECEVRVYRSTPVTVLGASVLGALVAAADVAVHVVGVGQVG